MNDELKMFTREEVANLLNTTKDSISMLIEIGVLTPIKIGKCYMFSRDSLKEMQKTYIGMDLSNKKSALKSYAEIQNRKNLHI